MTTLTNDPHATCDGLPRLGWPRLVWPRPAWRRLLDRVAALDALHRERANLRALDDYMLRDIGLTRADVEDGLSRPDAHLRLILLRGGDEIQH